MCAIYGLPFTINIPQSCKRINLPNTTGSVMGMGTLMTMETLSSVIKSQSLWHLGPMDRSDTTCQAKVKFSWIR